MAFFTAPAPVINEMQNAPALFHHLKSAVHAQPTSHVVELETLSLREIRAALPQTVVESTMVEVDSRNCMPT